MNSFPISDRASLDTTPTLDASRGFCVSRSVDIIALATQRSESAPFVPLKYGTNVYRYYAYSAQ